MEGEAEEELHKDPVQLALIQVPQAALVILAAAVEAVVPGPTRI
jgi:hypothetical protein